MDMNLGKLRVDWGQGGMASCSLGVAESGRDLATEQQRQSDNLAQFLIWRRSQL